MDGLLGNLKILRVASCQKLTTIPPLKLGSLEELDLSFSDNLSHVLHMFLDDKLKILKVTSRNMLSGIPPLKLASLEQLDLLCLDND
jgi:hypothetical protein